MKIIKVFIITVGMSLLTVGAAMADNSLETGAKALSFGVANGDIEISGRYFLGSDLALLAGAGFSHASNNDSTSDYSLTAGIRKYFKKTDLAPFVGGIVSFRRNDIIVSAPGGNDVESEKTYSIDGVGGLEYFFAKQVSVEAQVGIGLSSIHNVDGTGDDQTQFGTFSSGITVNFYFP
ncbi:MAG TPA: hypothetical protein VMN77_11450 [Nitrospiria bacterium]|jgi:hypothetical protein|nr:hypothetical protein [Nitrospiria bacterium]